MAPQIDTPPVLAPVDPAWLTALIQRAADAARLLGLEQHQLRDERRRGRLTASRIVNREIRYLRSDLMQYLLRRREGGNDAT